MVKYKWKKTEEKEGTKMVNNRTLEAVREREREPYFTKINNGVLFNVFTSAKVLKNNKIEYKKLRDSITMSVLKIDTG